MDAFSNRMERLEEQVSYLTEEVVRDRLKVVRLEREVNTNQKKIADLEQKNATPPACRCKCESDKNDIKELKLKVIAFEKEFEGVKIKCDSLSKLQVLLNCALLKCQTSALFESQIKELQKKQRKLCGDVTAWQYALVDHQQLQADLLKLRQDVDEMQDVGKEAEAVQGATAKPSQSKKVSIQSSGKVYHTSLCDEGISIDHASGMFEFNETDSSNSYGCVISAQPLNTDFASFSIEILHIGHNGYIAMGVKYLDSNTWHYFARYTNDGSIYNKEKETFTDVGKCEVGDTMGCRLDIKGRTVTFLRNDIHVHTLSLKKNNAVRPLHPIIEPNGTGTAVKAREISPWRK